MVRIISAAALMLVASLAFAAPLHGSQYSARHDPLRSYIASDPTVVTTAGVYAGRDPDGEYFVKTALFSEVNRPNI
jgi:hypothetical protein